jgi:predicted RNA-binding protein with PUA-like domain
VQIVKEAYPDPTAFDPSSRYFDRKSSPDSPRWFMVDIRLVRRLSRFIPLRELKTHDCLLQGLPLLSKGSRLSIQPINADHWHHILALENTTTDKKND